MGPIVPSGDRASASGALDPAVHCPPPFRGYPYLVTRIGHSALRHLAVVPGDWPRDRLVDLTNRQALANQLETCVCLGPADAVYVTPGREPCEASYVPSGVPVVDRLVIAGPLPDTIEQARRRQALRAYAQRLRSSGYLVGDGLEGGRLASAADVARLSGLAPNGLPPGLRPCFVCGRPRGDYLALRGEGNGDRTPRVIEVQCRCDNHNRCAGCGEPLAVHRLSAYYWDEERSTVRYVAAYCGLSHRCG